MVSTTSILLPKLHLCPCPAVPPGVDGEQLLTLPVLLPVDLLHHAPGHTGSESSKKAVLEGFKWFLWTFHSLLLFCFIQSNFAVCTQWNANN